MSEHSSGGFKSHMCFPAIDLLITFVCHLQDAHDREAGFPPVFLHSISVGREGERERRGGAPRLWFPHHVLELNADLNQSLSSGSNSLCATTQAVLHTD